MAHDVGLPDWMTYGPATGPVPQAVASVAGIVAQAPTPAPSAEAAPALPEDTEAADAALALRGGGKFRHLLLMQSGQLL